MTENETEDIRVVRNDDEGRYEIWVGDELAGLTVIDVRPEFTVMPHTEIREEFGGRSLATRLVRTALDDLRSRGDRIVALCPLIAAFVRKHPEYEDLLARPLD